MTTVTIYKVTCTKAYMMCEQGHGFSLEDWGNNTMEYEGYDDGGKKYTMPNGYTVEELTDGRHAIFDPDGGHCDLFAHSCGRPQLISGRNKMPVMALSASQNLSGAENHE